MNASEFANIFQKPMQQDFYENLHPDERKYFSPVALLWPARHFFGAPRTLSEIKSILLISEISSEYVDKSEIFIVLQRCFKP